MTTLEGTHVVKSYSLSGGLIMADADLEGVVCCSCRDTRVCVGP